MEVQRKTIKQSQDKVTIGDLLRDGHAPGALILLLTIPNMLIIPSVPVLPFLCGLPSMLLLAGMAKGSQRSMLPNWCLRLGLGKKSAERCVNFGRRLSFLASEGRMQHLLNGWLLTIVCCMGIALTFATCLPLPLFNLPVGFSCLFLAMGLARRDGLLAWTGTLAGIPSLAFLVWAPTHLWAMAGLAQP